ncbi:OsmC family peroxiredoxin [Microbacterium deminutum]|uniref:OsmC family peroxiredoxin n=1 Tax=Microbacterium deminutum TaxID=344164 RepID=A0ABP5BPB8_9MICO
MTVTSEATTAWKGSLIEGSGTVSLVSSGLATFDVDWKARSEGSTGITTPEELLAAAHSSCFSMEFSSQLAKNGTPPESIETTASVTFQKGVGITGSHLNVNAVVPGISPEDFERLAENARSGCPVSRALAGIDITLEATLA